MAEPTASMATGYFGIKASTLVAQIIGQLISLSFMAPMEPWKKVSTVASGVACAHYATQLVLHYIPQVEPVHDAIGFCCGLLGMAVMKSAIDVVPKVFDRLLGRI